MKPKLISVTEFCAMLGIGKTKAYEILNVREVGEVASLTIGRRRLVIRSSAEKFIKRSLEKGAL
jgi:hypothetical protein